MEFWNSEPIQLSSQLSRLTYRHIKIGEIVLNSSNSQSLKMKKCSVIFTDIFFGGRVFHFFSMYSVILSIDMYFERPIPENGYIKSLRDILIFMMPSTKILLRKKKLYFSSFQNPNLYLFSLLPKNGYIKSLRDILSLSSTRYTRFLN